MKAERDTRHRGEGMDVCQNGVDCNKELWPIEHPVEPPDEDQPVKCPMPHTSLVNRTDISAVMNEEGMMVVAAEPPAQAVRKSVLAMDPDSLRSHPSPFHKLKHLQLTQGGSSSSLSLPLNVINYLSQGLSCGGTLVMNFPRCKWKAFTMKNASERSNDMFCDDIFGESPAGVRKT
ncbi:unnamed protein product [Camellia sinensis]